MSKQLSKRINRIRQGKALDGIEKRIVSGTNLSSVDLKELQSQSAHMRNKMGIKAKKIVPAQAVAEVVEIKAKRKVKKKVEAVETED